MVMIDGQGLIEIVNAQTEGVFGYTRKELLGQIEEELGYHVLRAADGPSALRLLQTPGNKIDLLFTDIVLPGGSHGGEIAEQAQRLQPGIVVLFTSGYDRNAITSHGRLDPGVELITKPFSYTELSTRVRSILDRVAPPPWRRVAAARRAGA